MGSGKLKGMSRHANLTDDSKREIVKRYLGGATQVELAREFHCRFYQVKAIIAEAEVTRHSLTTNTPIECRLHDALMAAGIGFTTQRRLVGRYVVDISVHQAPVVIEADGARHRAGIAAQERDAIRDAAHEAAGYRVFRFSGSEINTDAVSCIQQVIDACGLVPDKEPVYDIRTKFSGIDHPRYVGQYELVCEYCAEFFLHPGRTAGTAARRTLPQPREASRGAPSGARRSVRPIVGGCRHPRHARRSVRLAKASRRPTREGHQVPRCARRLAQASEATRRARRPAPRSGPPTSARSVTRPSVPRSALHSRGSPRVRSIARTSVPVACVQTRP